MLFLLFAKLLEDKDFISFLELRKDIELKEEVEEEIFKRLIETFLERQKQQQEFNEKVFIEYVLQFTKQTKKENIKISPLSLQTLKI